MSYLLNEKQCMHFCKRMHRDENASWHATPSQSIANKHEAPLLPPSQIPYTLCVKNKNKVYVIHDEDSLININFHLHHLFALSRISNETLSSFERKIPEINIGWKNIKIIRKPRKRFQEKQRQPSKIKINRKGSVLC